ncbi:efflux RND transporter periplasmic adaptor subunit [Neiella marina]|uniref:Efflux RND transporter periplasmic adaptor subunit n=1 Tax=Neiella holothuriorum TaxID=2870530 RepID=A0ABS7EDR7_9GAMM|nr:efflux RND transporter periplasmic adaptor subunit [Neiella holothuriorum]MBW8190473.1 efflux RND transporter periplasmic adaptor subunit [Neiella holothuriorum]
MLVHSNYHGLALATLTSLTVFLSACSEAPKQAPPPPKVEYAEVIESSMKPVVEFVGRTVASEDVSIKARVSGQLLSRNFTEGANVQAADLLFEIDPAHYQAEVSLKTASLEQAESAYQVAMLQYSRGKKLNDKKLLSDMDMDELTSRMLQAKSAVAGAQSSLDVAKLNLEYTKVYAPIAGRMSQSEVFLGDQITPDKQMANLVQLDPMWIDFQISERSALNAAREVNKTGKSSIEDLTVKLRLPNDEIYEHTGTINSANNRVDPATGTISIRATFSNPKQLLLPGMYVSLIIESKEDEQAILVQQRAISQDQQGHFVLVIDAENKVEKRIVSVGKQYGINWHITDGLSIGENVIVSGLQKVRPGVTVDPVESQPLPFAGN